MSSTLVPASIYNSLIAFFDDNKGTIVQIEILPIPPTPIHPILTDTTFLGIPKKSLILAFTHARIIFLSALPLFTSKLPNFTRNSPKLAQHPSISPLPTTFHDLISSLLNATTILLLFDSEYLTAVNTRRRILLYFPEFSSVRNELHLLDSILTSPLHRHSKSPNLWAYKRWIGKTFSLISPLGRLHIDHSSDSDGNEHAEYEMNVVLKAAERHPKNYYAWSHARHLLSSRPASINHAKIINWCYTHPADISAWSFLLLLWQYTATSHVYDNEISPETANRKESRHSYYELLLQIMVFSHETAPGHETIWYFIERVLMSPDILSHQQKRDALDVIRSWGSEEDIYAAEDIVRGRKLMRKALERAEQDSISNLIQTAYSHLD